jgi:surface carbohydrate biosynthesis protein
MSKWKISIVVDHPRRDLTGLALLASHLAEKSGFEVFLTPMNLQMEEFVRIQPDLVILTGIRKTTEPILRFLKERDVTVCALETEGSFFFNEDHMMGKFSADPEIGQLFDKFFAWGDRITNILRRNLPVSPEQIVTTGTPRFDLFQKFKKAIPSQILINTNFAFLSETPEVRRRKYKTFGYDSSGFFLGLDDLREEYVQLAKYLDQELKGQLKIVYRPHPFEDLTYYDGKFSGTGVELNTEGTVDQQIARSYLTIQNNCTTGIESVQADVPTFSISYIPCTYRVEAFEVVSDFSSSREELLDKIRKVLSKTYSFDKNEKLKRVEAYIDNISEESSSIEKITAEVLGLLSVKKKKAQFDLKDYKLHPYLLPRSKWIYFLRRGKSIDKRKNWKKSPKAFFSKYISSTSPVQISHVKGILSVKIIVGE